MKQKSLLNVKNFSRPLQLQKNSVLVIHFESYSKKIGDECKFDTIISVDEYGEAKVKLLETFQRETLEMEYEYQLEGCGKRKPKHYLV